jgi:DNA polymerase III alpha subunit
MEHWLCQARMKSVDHRVSLDLKDRTLWFDGDSSMYSDRIAEMLLSGMSIDHLHPLEIDQSVKKYNLYADKELELKADIRPLDTSYTIPQKYLDIDLYKFVMNKLMVAVRADNITDSDQIEARIERVVKELDLFKQYNMENLIRVAIYIVDRFEEESIVWGTGRGSSCACYSLYLIGLHEVDSVKYDLALTEFFR